MHSAGRRHPTNNNDTHTHHVVLATARALHTPLPCAVAVRSGSWDHTVFGLAAVPTAVHLTFIHQHRLLLRHCHPSSHSCCTTGQPPRLQPTAQAGHTLRLLILLQSLQVLLLQLATCPVHAPASCCCCCCFVFCSVGHQAAANSCATCGCTQAPDADVAICTNAQQLVAHKRSTCKYTIARGDGVHSFGLV